MIPFFSLSLNWGAAHCPCTPVADGKSVVVVVAVVIEENGHCCWLNYPSSVGSAGDRFASAFLFPSLMPLDELRKFKNAHYLINIYHHDAFTSSKSDYYSTIDRIKEFHSHGFKKMCFCRDIVPLKRFQKPTSTLFKKINKQP